ncbi:MAG: TRAP transporter small permease [Thermodesulfobacteriota bacterium]|nr:TRAP transporter small permease [Thermodesulfobacteriota bacterium]
MPSSKREKEEQQIRTSQRDEGKNPSAHLTSISRTRSLFLGRIVNYFEESGVIAALSAMTLLYSLSIISRYITKTSMPWADELVTFLFIWATFLGTSIGVKRGAHLGVSVLQASLPPKLQKYLAIVITLCCVFTCAVLAWHGIRMVHLQFSMGQRSSQLGVPIFLVGLAVPIGLLLSILRFIQVLIVKLKP